MTMRIIHEFLSVKVVVVDKLKVSVCLCLSLSVHPCDRSHTDTNIISGVMNTYEAHIKVKDTILLSVFSPRFPPPLPVSANRQLQASRRSESVKRDCIYSGT